MNNKKYPASMTAVKVWKLEISSCGQVFKTGTVTCNKFDLLKLVKAEYAKYREERDGVYIKFVEVPSKPKPLTSLFLEKDKREAVCTLLKDCKALFKSYDKEDVKRVKLHDFAVGMWNDLQNEFYMSADICWNSIWKYQDALQQFDSMGYLLVGKPVKLSAWSVKISENFHREWAIEVLKLIKDFNLDNQPEDYSAAFMNDFMAVHNRQQFCGVLCKWTDLIRWSPDKLSLLDGTFVQPVAVHYEDDYNPDVDSDAYLD